MPQLVPRGKYIFGWSLVGDDGRIIIPPEAFVEYGFSSGEKIIVLPGSKRSGGFGLARASKMTASPIGRILEKAPELAQFEIPEGKILRIMGRDYCWASIVDGGITLFPEMLKTYCIEPGHRLLVGRGSGMALAFIARGPIVQEGEKHALECWPGD